MAKSRNPDLARPEGLCVRGERAHDVIVALLVKRRATYTGGGTAFYSPAQWAARGEEYGLNAVLIVVHDGGSPGDFFSYDREQYKRVEEMDETLKGAGFHADQCTTWYSAVYADRDAPACGHADCAADAALATACERAADAVDAAEEGRVEALLS